MQAISFDFSFELTIRGVRVENSPKFHMAFNMCKNVHVERISIKAPANSPNTDGIHLEKTNNLKIYNSFISSGM
jgi:polygalacturonase